MKKSNRTPPGPHGLPLLGNMFEIQRDPLRFLLKTMHRYGGIVRYYFFKLPIYALNHPDYIKYVLQDNNRNYNKDVFDYNLLKVVLGKGLLTDDGESWLHQRRLIQPAFHRQRIAALGTLMTSETLTMLDHWQAAAEQDKPLDIAVEMMRLTMGIVCKALFSTDVGETAGAVGEAFTRANRYLTSYMYFPFPPLSVPTPRNRRLMAANATLARVVDNIIRERRQRNEDSGDLLSMLLHAQDEETGKRMSDQQVHDDVLTLFVAGHETTSNALNWTWYLLSQHPAVEKRLHAELAEALAGRTPGFEDLPNLPYTRMVIEESMRLYPPAWGISRKAIADDVIGGYYIPANAYILLLPYTVHRNADFWENPGEFDPERFTPERVAARPRYAYFPFGGGPRMCIGSSFALTEAQLILATVAQRYRLSLVPEHHVEPEPLVTLRLRHGLMMKLLPGDQQT